LREERKKFPDNLINVRRKESARGKGILLTFFISTIEKKMKNLASLKTKRRKLFGHLLRRRKSSTKEGVRRQGKEKKEAHPPL